jgi:hypothetical protein
MASTQRDAAPEDSHGKPISTTFTLNEDTIADKF